MPDVMEVNQLAVRGVQERGPEPSEVERGRGQPAGVPFLDSGLKRIETAEAGLNLGHGNLGRGSRKQLNRAGDPTAPHPSIKFQIFASLKVALGSDQRHRLLSISDIGPIEF